MLALWLAGLAHWLVLLQGVRLAHWAVHFGWIILAAYLAIYLPLFVALTRAAVRRLRVPLPLAAPLVWTGLEYVRGRFATGFSVGLLGHTQAEWTTLIQISDLAGAYAVSFLVMFVSGCVAVVVPERWLHRGPPLCGGDSRASGLAALSPVIVRGAWLAAALSAVVASLAYGAWRLERLSAPEEEAAATVALLQQPIHMFFAYDPEENRQTFDRYLRQAIEAAERHPQVDVIVWPESIFSLLVPLTSRDDRVRPPDGAGIKEHEYAAMIDAARARFFDMSAQVAGRLGGDKSLLVGASAMHYSESNPPESCNAALLIRPDGEIAGRYDKMHPVMFGEYVPLGRRLPWLYRLTPLPGGLTEGCEPAAFEIQGVRLAPNICFESTTPHLIRRQFLELERQGNAPDALVNLTNDGWFRSSAIIDLHYRCGVFRAVEMRRPFLTSANAGFSAWIDAGGRARSRGPRREEAVIVAPLGPQRASSWYRQIGDWPAAGCAFFCLAVAVAGLAPRRTENG